MDTGAVDSPHLPYVGGTLSMWGRHTVADVPAELHYHRFQASEYPRKSVGHWMVLYSPTYHLLLAAPRNSLFCPIIR